MNAFASRETHPPQADNSKPRRKYRKRGVNVSACSGCENEEKLPGQRYGRICHAKAQREYHARQREMERKIREILKVVQKIEI